MKVEVEVQPALKKVKNCFFVKKAAALVEADAIQVLKDQKYLPGSVNTVIDDTGGDNLIQLGVRNLAPQFVKNLLQWQANPNLTNNLGETPLHILLDSEQYSNQRFKYDRKERKYTFKGEQRIEIGVAEREAAIKTEKDKRMEILEILFAEKNVKLNIKNTINLPNKKKEKETPLAITIRKGLTEEGKFLLKQGALVTEENIKVAEQRKDLDADFLQALKNSFQSEKIIKTVQVPSYNNVTKQLKQETTNQISGTLEITGRVRANTIVAKPLPLDTKNKEIIIPKKGPRRSKSVDFSAEERLNAASTKNNNLLNQSQLSLQKSPFVKAKVTVVPVEQINLIPPIKPIPHPTVRRLNPSLTSGTKELNTTDVKGKKEIKPVISPPSTSYFRK